MNIYGQEIELDDDIDGTAMEIIIVTRVVKMHDDGAITDDLIVNTSDNMTGIIYEGMLAYLNQGALVELGDE